MAKAALCDMKMRNVLLVVFLGLLAVVHSTPVDTMTQILPKAEDDVLREAVTDGFIVNHSFLFSRTTKSPQTNTSLQSSQQPESTTQPLRHELDMIEGSATGGISDRFTTSTTQSVSSAESSTFDSFTSSTTQSPQSGSTPSSVPNAEEDTTTSVTHSSTTTDQSSVSPTTASDVTSSYILSTLSDSGSGDEDYIDQYSATTSSGTSETSPVSSSSTTPLVRDIAPRIFQGIEEPTSGSGMPENVLIAATIEKNSAEVGRVSGSEDDVEEQPPGHTTPDWIIILGFVVGVAALVMLLVAIATRDKWNAPKYAAQPETNTNSSNQQRAIEMETFLDKEMPKENGKAAEYTVIPLDELPENYSSH